MLYILQVSLRSGQVSLYVSFLLLLMLDVLLQLGLVDRALLCELGKFPLPLGFRRRRGRFKPREVRLDDLG